MRRRGSRSTSDFRDGGRPQNPEIRCPMERPARTLRPGEPSPVERNRLDEVRLSMWNDVMPPQSTVILITSLQLGRSRSDMSYDVAGLGLGGEKKKGKRKMYLYAGVAVVVIVIVIVAVWWTRYRM